MPAALGLGAGFGDLRRRHLRGAEGSDFPSGNQAGERIQRLVQVGVRIWRAELVDVDVAGLQAPQRTLDGLGDPPAGAAAVVRVPIQLHAELHRQDDLIPPATGQRLAEDFLGLARGVTVREC